MTQHKSSGAGSTGNVIAAVCSFFVPGLGQLVQGRLFMALVHFIMAAVLWWILMGWIVHPTATRGDAFRGPRRVRWISLARSSTRRCFEIAGWDMR